MRHLQARKREKFVWRVACIGFIVLFQPSLLQAARHDYPIVKGCSVSRQVLLLLSIPSQNLLRARLLHLQVEGERPLSDKLSIGLACCPFSFQPELTAAWHFGAITFAGGLAADAWAP